MDPLLLIDKYYPEDNELKHILLKHSRSVADKALAMARKHPAVSYTHLTLPTILRV